MNPMCAERTPLEHYPDLGLWVKREDLSCPGGPNFSKTRGVYAHVASRPERMIGVLDTSHSQGGWAVAKACNLLGKQCRLYYPVRKAERADPQLKVQQLRARELGATLVPIQAGRSAVLYHQARKMLAAEGGAATYMMPNALKLPEMITETVAELGRTRLPESGTTVLVSASSGTIAAGVLLGLLENQWSGRFIVHQGYSRPAAAIEKYMWKMIGGGSASQHPIQLVDEGYSYADAARPGPLPPFPCNEYYDLKAFRWWVAKGRDLYGSAMLWNIG